MSTSSFCLEQREKEKAALKSILAYSIASSAALHLVFAFGFALLAKEPSLANDPIEVVVLDAAEPEIKKPEVETPKPTPQPVVPPKPEKVVATPTPEPIPTSTPEPIPTPTPEPIPTPKVEVPKPLEKPVEPEEVKEPEPIKTPDIPEPEKVSETLPPPKVPETVTEDLQKPDPPLTKPETETANNPQPLPTPSANPRDFKEQLAETQQPVEKETRTEETPQLPGGLTANQQPPVDNSRVTSEPLESSVAGNREFRDRIAANNNSTSVTTPSDDNSLMNPGIPGEVSTNRENITNKPTATSQPLLTSTNGDRDFRTSIANSNNSPTTTNPGSDISNGTPGIPGQVAANNQRPNNRPVGGSQPLQTATNNRGFRNSFSNNDSSNNYGSPFGTSNPQTSPTTPGTSTGVAANQPPARRNSGQEGGNTRGDRSAARTGARRGRLRCVSGCYAEAPSNLRFEEGVQVVIKHVIEADGSTAEPQVVKSSGDGQVDEAAIEALLKMRFAPPEGGRRIATTPVTFKEKERFSF